MSPMQRVEIRAKDYINGHRSEWFEDLVLIHTEAGRSALRDLIVDREALLPGLLAKLRKLASPRTGSPPDCIRFLGGRVRVKVSHLPVGPGGGRQVLRACLPADWCGASGAARDAAQVGHRSGHRMRSLR